jgi:imidazolonepropionase-like amidohydrolase
LLDAGLYKTHTKLDFIRRFHKMGVPIVAGTDAITTFGDYAIGLELLHRAGLSTMEVIVSATSLAAKALGWQDQVGTVNTGMLADLIYVDGDPLTEIQALDRVISVVLDGKLAVDKEVEKDTTVSAATDNAATLSTTLKYQ